MLKRLLKAYSINRPGTFLIIIGSLTWIMTMIKSGLRYSYGVGFWGPNGHDGIWHIALSQSLAENSWQMPVFAGEAVKNYHIGFDLLLAILFRVTRIPIINLYFQVLPVIFAVTLGVSFYIFIYTWRRSKADAFWSTFFLYFGGSFGWLYTLAKDGQLGGESLFWSQQSVSTLINPPFVLSLIFLFLGLTFAYKGVITKNKSNLILATFLFGVLIQIKIYAGLLILFGLFTSAVIKIIIKKDFDLLKLFTGVLVISVLLFSGLDGSSQNIIIFKPFWFLNNLFSSPDRFYWPKFSEALANYVLALNIPKALLAYIVAVLIFIAGNFGTRVVGVFWMLKRVIREKEFDFMETILYSILAAGIVIPLLFIQSGTPWNTIQFFYYSEVVIGIFAGFFVGKLTRSNKLVAYPAISVFVLLTLPTTIGTLWYNYLPMRPPAMISNKEIEALSFLRSQPTGVVLTQGFDPILAGRAVNNPPRPLYLYESTAYVSALTDKSTYLEDEVNLNITDYDWQVRRREVDRFFKDPTFDGKFELLQKRGIDYVYVVNDLLDQDKDLHLKDNMIFNNGLISIYKFEY